MEAIVNTDSSHAAMLRVALAARGLAPLVDAVLSQHPTVTLDEVLSPCRSRAVSEARAHLAYELYDVARSYPRVGAILGIDHSSAIAARRRWARIVGDVGAARPRKSGAS